MKLIIATAVAALASTAAFADLSTKEMDLRLDTSTQSMNTVETSNDVTEGSLLDGEARAQSSYDMEQADAGTTLSTRSDIASPGQGYPYGGYGEGNDSR